MELVFGVDHFSEDGRAVDDEDALLPKEVLDLVDPRLVRCTEVPPAAGAGRVVSQDHDGSWDLFEREAELHHLGPEAARPVLRMTDRAVGV